MMMYCQLYMVWYYSCVPYIGYMSQCLYCRRVLVLYYWLWYLVFSSMVSVFAVWKSLQQNLTQTASKEILIHFESKGELRWTHTNTHTHIKTSQAFRSLYRDTPWRSPWKATQYSCLTASRSARLKEPICPLIFWEEVHIVPNLFHQLSLPHYLPHLPPSPDPLSGLDKTTLLLFWMQITSNDTFLCRRGVSAEKAVLQCNWRVLCSLFHYFCLHRVDSHIKVKEVCS